MSVFIELMLSIEIYQPTSVEINYPISITVKNLKQTSIVEY